MRSARTATETPHRGPPLLERYVAFTKSDKLREGVTKSIRLQGLPLYERLQIHPHRSKQRWGGEALLPSRAFRCIPLTPAIPWDNEKRIIVVGRLSDIE
jgi:hypothetical protein